MLGPVSKADHRGADLGIHPFGSRAAIVAATSGAILGEAWSGAREIRKKCGPSADARSKVSMCAIDGKRRSVAPAADEQNALDFRHRIDNAGVRNTFSPGVGSI